MASVLNNLLDEMYFRLLVPQLCSFIWCHYAKNGLHRMDKHNHPHRLLITLLLKVHACQKIQSCRWWLRWWCRLSSNKREDITVFTALHEKGVLIKQDATGVKQILLNATPLLLIITYLVDCWGYLSIKTILFWGKWKQIKFKVAGVIVRFLLIVYLVCYLNTFESNFYCFVFRHVSQINTCSFLSCFAACAEKFYTTNWWKSARAPFLIRLIYDEWLHEKENCFSKLKLNGSKEMILGSTRGIYWTNKEETWDL